MISKTTFLKDIIIVFIISFSPFVFFVYNFAPKYTQAWKTNYFNLEIVHFEDVNYFAWNISVKTLFIILCLIWFVTCKHWWRYTILVPLTIEIHKLSGILNSELYIFHDYKFYHSILVSVPILVIIIYLSNKKNFYNKLDDEIDQLMLNLSRFKSENYKIFKRRYIDLKKEKHNLDKREYLKRLIQLREEFANQ